MQTTFFSCLSSSLLFLQTARCPPPRLYLRYSSFHPGVFFSSFSSRLVLSRRARSCFLSCAAPSSIRDFRFSDYQYTKGDELKGQRGVGCGICSMVEESGMWRLGNETCLRGMIKLILQVEGRLTPR